MNRDDLFKLVKAWADEVTDGNGYVTYEFDPPALERFAALVAAAEREACAKVCEQPIDEIQITDDCSEYKYRDNQECADAIRERGAP